MCMPVKCTETTESFSFFIFLNLAHATDNVNVTLHPKKALVKITGRLCNSSYVAICTMHHSSKVSFMYDCIAKQ